MGKEGGSKYGTEGLKLGMNRPESIRSLGGDGGIANRWRRLIDQGSQVTARCAGACGAGREALEIPDGCSQTRYGSPRS